MDSREHNEQKTRIQLADEALENRDYIRALRYYRDAVQLEPYNHRILINLGFCYARTNNFSEAKNCFETALQLQPDNRVAKQNLSRIKSVKTRNILGSEKKSVRIRPEEMVFIRYMQWGSELIKKKNYFSALQFYREASGIHPDFVEPYKRIGYCYAKLHNYHEAAEAFEDALHIYQDDPISLDCLTRCKQRLVGYSTRMPETDKSHESGIKEEKTPFMQKPKTGDDSITEAETTSSDITSSSVAVRDNTKQKATDSSVLSPEPEPKPFASKMSDDDLVNAILSHYTDERSEDAKPSPETGHDITKQETTDSSVLSSGQESKQNQIPSKTSDDDLVNAILSQYTNGKSEDAKPSPETDHDITKQETIDSSALSSGQESKQNQISSKTSDDDLVAAILAQHADEISEDITQPETEKAVTPKQSIETDMIDAVDQTENQVIPEEIKKRRNVNLTDEQMDALRELGNIGASHAATTLSTMLNTPIMLEVPEISIDNFNTINTKLEQEDAALVYFKMEGEISDAGYVVLHVPKESVIQMTSIMLGLPPDLNRELDEMDESALNEIGNIMVSAFLDGTAELLGIIMLPSPPRILFDKPKKLFNLIIEESNISYESVVFFKTEMQCDTYELTCNILMLPNPPVLHDIIKMLEQLIEDSLNSGN